MDDFGPWDNVTMRSDTLKKQASMIDLRQKPLKRQKRLPFDRVAQHPISSSPLKPQDISPAPPEIELANTSVLQKHRRLHRLYFKNKSETVFIRYPPTITMSKAVVDNTRLQSRSMSHIRMPSKPFHKSNEEYSILSKSMDKIRLRKKNEAKLIRQFRIVHFSPVKLRVVGIKQL